MSTYICIRNSPFWMAPAASRSWWSGSGRSDRTRWLSHGGVGRHGGGAFSGKDPTKVDRSAAYAARHVAKNIVAAGIAKRCEVELAYAIGVAQPVSVFVDTFGTGVKPDSEISAAVSKVFDLRPSAIISSLNLRNTKYRPLAAYGHMGRTDLDVAWEKTNKVDELKSALDIK